MTNRGLEVRDLTSADIDEVFAVRTRSFGRLDDALRDGWNANLEQLILGRRAIGAFTGERLVAAAKGLPFQQFWGGHPVPMTGIAGVVVEPAHRGRGVASSMLRALAERGVELGDAVSALYPATVAPYRRNGWEVVGAQARIAIDTHLLRGLDTGSVRVRPGEKADLDHVEALLDRRYAAQRANGPKLLSRVELEQALTDADGFCYVAEDGFVLYEWDDHTLVVTCLVAHSEATARALWAVVGTGSSIARTVHAYVSPDDPIHLLLPEEASHDVHLERWMLRILDAPRAVAARGYAEHLSGAARLSITDPMRESHSGEWVLEVDAGRGSLTRDAAGRAALQVGPNGLASLYAGTPVHTLRAAGLAGGGSPEGDAFLDAAFGGTPAYLLEYF
jgi:predicted acetyltransferase